jgi:hypothetical protein|tara:strand:+ start:113 stop:334 length:222 start_codon:yes stop_codon:yes gene_type:complete
MKIKAIYKKGKDDNYDLVAAFAGIFRHTDANQFAYGLMEDGAGTYLVKEFKDLDHVTDGIEGWEANFEKKLGV